MIRVQVGVVGLPFAVVEAPRSRKTGETWGTLRVRGSGLLLHYLLCNFHLPVTFACYNFK